jgi:hypothetical protein
MAAAAVAPAATLLPSAAAAMSGSPVNRPVYRAHVVKRRLKMLRSDGEWHDCVVSAWDAKAGLHLIDFVGPGGAIEAGDWYDLNHPLRMVRWYADGEKPGTLGPLLREHVLPASVATAAASPVVSGGAAGVGGGATLAAPKPRYVNRTLPATGSVLMTSTASGARYILRQRDNMMLRVYSPAHDGSYRCAEPPPDCAGGWPEMQARAAASGADPHGLLWRRIRVYWPMDHAWFHGRVTAYNAGTGQHQVHYDDGDARWYLLTAKQYALLPEVRGEAVGRKVAIETAPRKWLIATVRAYEPDIDVHRWVGVRVCSEGDCDAWGAGVMQKERLSLASAAAAVILLSAINIR